MATLEINRGSERTANENARTRQPLMKLDGHHHLHQIQWGPVNQSHGDLGITKITPTRFKALYKTGRGGSCSTQYRGNCCLLLDCFCPLGSKSG